jgi:hypothetical protein
MRTPYKEWGIALIEGCETVDRDIAGSHSETHLGGEFESSYKGPVLHTLYNGGYALSIHLYRVAWKGWASGEPSFELDGSTIWIADNKVLVISRMEHRVRSMKNRGWINFCYTVGGVCVK